MRYWEFPLKIQTLNTTTEETGYRIFETQEEFTSFMWEQFLVPGEYNLRNTHRWKDAGNQYTNTVTKPNFEGGYYTKAIKGTHSYKKYWGNEKERVKNGIIIDNVFLPPFYYWYLNFCPIFDDVKGKKRLGDVWDSDLWFFHYIMLCVLLGKHACVLKTRQRGYSFKIMAILYWSYSWHEGSVNTIGAYKDDSTLKSWRFLEFYRKHINATTAWKRGPVVPSKQEWVERTDLKMGGYYGNDAKLSATTFKVDPENGVGGNQSIFFYEESGIAPKLLQTIGYIRPALEKGNVVTGLIIVSGAIGDLDDCKDLKSIFYNPKAHNFLSVKNIWDQKPEHKGKDCALFVSEAYNLEGYMDKEGNSLFQEAFTAVNEKNKETRETKEKKLAQLDISQKPLSPEEAFAQRRQSEFPVEELQRQQDRIKLKDKEGKWKRKPLKCLLYEDEKGNIQFKVNDLPPEHEYPIDPKWEDKRGVITIYEHPDKDTPWFTYFAGVDTVEADETTSSESIQSVDIYKKIVKVKYKDEKGVIKIRYEGGKIVATYRGRFNPVEKHNEQTWLLIRLYNAFTYQERSKPNFQNYMKRNGRAQKYLAKESDVPMFKDLNNNSMLSKSAYGFHLSPNNQIWNIFKSNVKEYFSQEFDRVEKEDGETVKIYTGIDRIDDYWLLEEYIQYNESDNFDRIISSAAAITIGKVYENEMGIPTINEVKEEPKQAEYRPPKQIDLLSGGMRGQSFNQNKNRKTKSLL